MKMLLFAFLLLACSVSNCLAQVISAEKKQWLVVENKPQGEIPPEFHDFSRLLLMKISKAGVFRCIDRSTYKTQKIELALGGTDDVDFVSAGYSISWIIRIRETPRGQIVTASIGYNNIGKDGNNELIRSEDVVVFERSLKGMDLATKVAEKASVAILFNLVPPQVLEVENAKNGKKMVVLDYGKGFLNEGDNIIFIRKKKNSRGKEFHRKIGEGVVSSVSSESAMAIVHNGEIKEGDCISVKEKEDKELLLADSCPKCDGRKNIKKEEKCVGCNGHGFTRIIKQRSRRYRDVKCNMCFGKGVKKKIVPCPECNGMGR
jgi:hypothetical protein